MLWSLRLLLIFSILLVPLVAFPYHASADTVTASDNFNRADGGLGSGWTAVSDGGMSISSQAVAGVGGATTGDIRTAETYGSDQFSQVEVTSTQLSGAQWVGPAVRMQNGGQNAYLGIYFWNSGSPALMLFVRNGGQLAAAERGYHRAAGGRDAAEAHRGGQHDLVPGQRGPADVGHRRHADRRRAGHHGA